MEENNTNLNGLDNNSGDNMANCIPDENHANSAISENLTNNTVNQNYANESSVSENKKEKLQKSSMHIAAFVLGIISIVTNLLWFIAWPTGICAIVMGVKSSRRLGSKLGKAGMIMGIVGLSLSALVYGTAILFIVADL